MEQQKEVRVIQVDYKCPQCDTGHMRSANYILTCSPPLYPHTCNNNECKYGENFVSAYPYIKYEEIY